VKDHRWAWQGLLVCGLVAVAHAEPERAPASAASLSIEDALRAADTASLGLAVAREDVERARTQIDVARSGWFPSVSGTAGYTRTLRSEFEDISFGAPAGTDVDLPFGQRNTWRLGLVVQQSIFDGGRTASSVKAARAGVRAGEHGVTNARAQAVLGIAQAYYDAVLAHRQVEIGQISLEQAERTLADTQLNFDQGAAPEFDLVRAQVARDNQDTALIRFRTERDVALVVLKRLIGTPLDRPLQLTSPLDADDLDAVVVTARNAAGVTGATRAAVEQAREVVRLREAALGVARADRLPQISAGSDFGLVDYASQPFNTDWKTNWTVGLNLSVPLFDGFRRRAAVRSARADVRIAQLQLEDASLQSRVETFEADADVAAATATLQTTARTVAQAQRAYEIAELRFQQGASTHLELVDARFQLAQSRLNHARSSRDVRVARLRRDLLAGLPLGAGAGQGASFTVPVGTAAPAGITAPAGIAAPAF
jgi:outer membrane protein